MDDNKGIAHDYADDDNTKPVTFQVHTSFAEIIDQYDGFILDQFGVMHNGESGLDGAPGLFKSLAQDHRKKLIILSNSSSSAESVIARLPNLGFDPKDLVGTVTSGQEAGQYIRDKYGSNSGRDVTPRKALFITWKAPKVPSPSDFLQLCGGNIPVTADPNEADYIILHGVDVVRGPHDNGVAEETSMGDFRNDGNMEPFEAILQRCVERRLPMICANPDLVMVKPDGSTGHMPGKIAQRYMDLGGTCTSFGKPDVQHFEACLRELGLPKDRVAHVGDSLPHDVAGANATGIASVFVTGGIHRTELGAELGVLPDRDKLEALFQQYCQSPTHVVPMFRY